MEWGFASLDDCRIDPCQVFQIHNLIGINALQIAGREYAEDAEPTPGSCKMGYKTISIILTDESDESALRSASAIALREDAHLDVHCLGIDPTRYEPMPAGASGVLMQTGIAEAKSQANALKEWALTILPREMNQVAIETVIVSNLGMDTLVARLARYSDLVVASKPYGDRKSPLQVQVLEAELFGSGAPVLVVPDTGATHDFERIAVAWNESSESFHAVRAAMPILRAADSVDIVMVDPPAHSPERSDPGGAICLMLARHDIRAEVSILARTLPRISDILERFTEEHDSDLLVMGGYGHSRFREAILGGATRDLLENCTRPLLMAH